MRLPTFVVNQLLLPDLLEPILSRLSSIMPSTPLPVLRTHNIVFVPTGSTNQDWHYDHEDPNHQELPSYFTILINLNHLETECGGTEIWKESGHDSVSKYICKSSSYLDRF